MRRVARAAVLSAALCFWGMDAHAQAPLSGTPKTFDEAHTLYGQNVQSLTDALNTAKCLDQKAVDAIAKGENAIGGIRQWIGALLLKNLSPIALPVPPGPEPVTSADDLKGRLAWANFMIGRLTYLIRALRQRKPCNGVTVPRPAQVKLPVQPSDAKPECGEEAVKASVELADVLTQMSQLDLELNGVLAELENAGQTLKQVKYFRQHPDEKPADFDIAVEEADALAQQKALTAEKDRIEGRLKALRASGQRIADDKARVEAKCPKPAAAIDPCLVGTWRSEPVTVAGAKQASGGEGIVMTIGADGMLTIDYARAVPIKGAAGETNQWQGSATGRISTGKGAVKVERVEKSALLTKYTGPNGLTAVRRASGLGPAAPGSNPTDRSYRCEGDSLSYNGMVYEIAFKRVR